MKVYKCDICGREMNIPNWMLITNSKSIVYSKKMDVCNDCAKWIKKQRGKGGEDE